MRCLVPLRGAYWLNGASCFARVAGLGLDPAELSFSGPVETSSVHVHVTYMYVAEAGKTQMEAARGQN